MVDPLKSSGLSTRRTSHRPALVKYDVLPEGFERHVVSANENFWTVAGKVKVDAEALMGHNPRLTTSERRKGTLLYEGDEILVPKADTRPVGAVGPVADPATVKHTETTYEPAPPTTGVADLATLGQPIPTQFDLSMAPSVSPSPPPEAKQTANARPDLKQLVGSVAAERLQALAASGVLDRLSETGLLQKAADAGLLKSLALPGVLEAVAAMLDAKAPRTGAALAQEKSQAIAAFAQLLSAQPHLGTVGELGNGRVGQTLDSVGTRLKDLSPRELDALVTLAARFANKGKDHHYIRSMLVKHLKKQFLEMPDAQRDALIDEVISRLKGTNLGQLQDAALGGATGQLSLIEVAQSVLMSVPPGTDGPLLKPGAAKPQGKMAQLASTITRKQLEHLVDHYTDNGTKAVGAGSNEARELNLLFEAIDVLRAPSALRAEIEAKLQGKSGPGWSAE